MKQEIKNLSEKNYNSLNENFLYKKKPIIDNSFSVGTTSGTYHCKNWTFTIKKEDGRAWATDTYWGSSADSKEITDKNVKEYKKIFDFREVIRIRDDEANEYLKKDLFYAATNSGGYSCGNLYWVKKTAQKSNRLLVEKKKKEIESYKRKLQWAEDNLKELMA